MACTGEHRLLFGQAWRSKSRKWVRIDPKSEEMGDGVYR